MRLFERSDARFKLSWMAPTRRAPNELSRSGPAVFRLIADGDDLDARLFGLENHAGAADDQFAHAAPAEAATNGEALGVARPSFSFRKRRITNASSWAKSSIALCTTPAAFQPRAA